MSTQGNTTLEGLSKFIFAAPEWPRSLAIMILLGLFIDFSGYFAGAEYVMSFGILGFGIFGYLVPALLALVLTKPLVEVFGQKITWNRSALLAMTGMVFQIIFSFLPLFFTERDLYPLLFAIAVSLVFSMRLITLLAIADSRVTRMLIPALIQSMAALATGYFYFGFDLVLFALILHLLFAGGVLLFIWMVETPLRRNFDISALKFINAFIAHNTDGSKKLEEYFLEIGEDVYVPQASLFFRREGKDETIVTVPNIHPGPMGEIGGGNLPSVLHSALGSDSFVLHGCATHDFNLVSESEVPRLAEVVRASEKGAVFTGAASVARRYTVGSVQVLAQRYGDTLLLVSTRSPAKTEDLDFCIGLAIMSECHSWFPNVAFVDAHNCMVDVTEPVLPASLAAHEYYRVCAQAAEDIASQPEYPLEIGTSKVDVPFSREEGFGDLGIQVFASRVNGNVMALILFDGNNVHEGVREEIIAEIGSIVDECEILTTDSHVVNTISGKNPVGYRVPVRDIVPYVRKAVLMALDDLAPAEAAGGTGWVEGITVFGSQRISQLASTVNAMLIYVAPLGVAILLFAFLLSLIAYILLLS